MDIRSSKERDDFWEAYRGCAEENRVPPDRSQFYMNYGPLVNSIHQMAINIPYDIYAGVPQFDLDVFWMFFLREEQVGIGATQIMKPKPGQGENYCRCLFLSFMKGSSSLPTGR
jgi:hypothetical protein